MAFSLKRYGEFGVLAFGLAERERAGLIKALGGGSPPGCIEFVEGYDTVLFLFRKPATIESVQSWLDSVELAHEAEGQRVVHEIPVFYDGPDLDFIASELELSTSEIIDLHSSPTYSVRMMGFTPGFPYLDGLDRRLHIPRRDSPRDRIEPGSVAIGGSHGGIYSVASPGGWHLLGRTEIELFNVDAARACAPVADHIFLLKPGDELRFCAVER